MWHLVVVDHVASIDKQIYKVVVRDKASSTDHFLYVTNRQATGNIDVIETFCKRALVFMRQVRSGAFSLTTLSRALRPVQFEAFGSLMALHEQMRSVGHFSHSKQRRQNSKNSTPLEKSRSPSMVNTAMSEAFAKAEQQIKQTR
jgi:hypothetical protein